MDYHPDPTLKSGIQKRKVLVKTYQELLQRSHVFFIAYLWHSMLSTIRLCRKGPFNMLVYIKCKTERTARMPLGRALSHEWGSFQYHKRFLHLNTLRFQQVVEVQRLHNKCGRYPAEHREYHLSSHQHHKIRWSRETWISMKQNHNTFTNSIHYPALPRTSLDTSSP